MQYTRQLLKIYREVINDRYLNIFFNFDYTLKSFEYNLIKWNTLLKFI